jgi:glycerol 2-dehydrogenase (NADP+)
VDAEHPDKVYPDWDYVKTWLEMQKLPASGRVRNLGISNFGPKHLAKLEAHPEYKIVPAVNQIELHPNCPSPKYLEYFAEKGIHLTAYSCLGSTDSPLYKDVSLKELASKKGKTVQQVLLMWGIQRGTSVIPKSVTDSRIKANFDLDGWELSEAELQQLSSMKSRFKVCGESWLPKGRSTVFYGDDE